MRKRAGIAIGLMLGVTGILVVQHLYRSWDEPKPEIEAPSGALALEESSFLPVVVETELNAIAESGSVGVELRPEEVIDRSGPDCVLHAGEGTAGDTAIVVMPPRAGSYRDGARFSVVDESGVVHAGNLPFFPFQAQLGRTGLGEVIVAVGGIRVDVPDSASLPPFGRGEPLRIYRDDQLIYEKDDVWLLDVASDGSSFFYVEPLGSDWSSRLVIVNLDRGTEAHYDLGTTFAHPEARLRYVASYTPSGEEVHLEPISRRYSLGLGTHYFFSTEGDWPGRGISVSDTGRDDLAHFVSSEEGYVLTEGSDSSESLQIRKLRLDWDNLRHVTEWHLQGGVGTRASAVGASRSGARILFRTATASTADRPAREEDRVLYVLDTATGEAEFVLPTLDATQQLRQVSSVLHAQAMIEDVGWYNGAFFSDDNTMVVRRSPNDVLDDTRRFYDVYDLNSVSLYGQPEFRIEGNQHDMNECASQGFPGGLVATADGRLAYARRLP